jgi:hypothetical protein
MSFVGMNRVVRCGAGAVVAAVVVLASGACGNGSGSDAQGPRPSPQGNGSSQQPTEAESPNAEPSPTDDAYPGAEPTEPGGEPLSGRGFVMPSRNIACLYAGGTLRCDLLSGLNPEPQQPCDFDWGGTQLDANGSAKPSCISDTIAGEVTAVLAYGQKWQGHGISCLSDESGLRCENGAGHGFFLSRESWRVF